VFRSPIIAGILSVCGFFAWAAGSGAQEPKAAPKELRMWHVGNSWSCPFPFEKVGLVRPFVLHTHNFGRSGKNWVEEALDKDKKEALVKAEIDVVYWGSFSLHNPSRPWTRWWTWR